MSRKKKRHEAVPAEIDDHRFGSGSGPVEAPVVTDDVVVAAEPAADVEAAEPAKTPKSKRSKPSDSDVAAESAAAESAAADVPADVAADAPAEVSAEPVVGAKKKKSKKRVGEQDAAVSAADAESAAAEGENDDVAADVDEDDLAAVETTAAGDELPADGASSDELAADGADSDELAADGAASELADGTLAPDATQGDALAADGDAPANGELAADGADAPVEGELPADAEVASDVPLLPTQMDAVQLRKLVEALIFATDKPITLQRLRQLTRISDVSRLESALAELAIEYQDRGIALHQVSGGYQFRTNTTYSPWVQQLIAGRPVRLSRAQLETLAIIAYRQPITRPEIDDIRGVDSSATLRLLLDRALVRVLGKREEVGRPILYGTTKEFLDFFSLSDLRELPTLREYSELTAESRQVMSDRLGVPLATEAELGAEMGVGIGDIDLGIRSDDEPAEGVDPADLAGSFPAASAAAAADASDAAFDGDVTTTHDESVLDEDQLAGPHDDDDLGAGTMPADDDDDAMLAGDRVQRTDSSDNAIGGDATSNELHGDAIRGDVGDEDMADESLRADATDDDAMVARGDEVVDAKADAEADAAEGLDGRDADGDIDSLSARAARRLRALDELPDDDLEASTHATARDERDEREDDADSDISGDPADPIDPIETAAALDPVTFDHEPGEAAEPIDEPNE